ncbi:hypothetical protein PTKIN_Ptkin01aG0123200 [Pterospermum kingtungense]
MGSLSALPQPTTPPAEYKDPSGYRVIIAAFCPKETAPNTNIFNCIQGYNPSNNTWSHVSLIPDLLENHVLKVGPWHKCAPLGIPRYDFACAVCENKIYVAGGKSNLGSPRGISSAEVYDPALDEWTPLPNMSTLRYKCVGLTWQGKICVVGGFAERSESDVNMVTFSPQRCSAEVLDTQAGRWDLVAGMWQLDVPPYQIVAVDGKLFSSGDCLNPWKGHIEVYDGKLNMWDEVDGSRSQTLNSLGANDENSRPMERLYLTMAPIGTLLYFLAGYGTGGESSRTLSMVHVFDTSATFDAWKSLEPMEEEGEKELCSHCCVVQLSSAL